MRKSGFTLIELLILTAILGIVAGIGIGQINKMAKRQQAASSVSALRQLFSQGASAASSRGGTSLVLVKSGSTLNVQTTDTNPKVVRSYTLPTDVTTSLQDGTLVTFTAPGKLNFSNLFPTDRRFTVTANGQASTLTVTLIGEVLRQ